MKINLISVGKLDKQYNQLADNYRKMITAKLTEHQITYTKKIPASNIKKFEADLITKKCTEGAILVVLDEHGKGLTSKQFSEFLSSAMMDGKSIDFIIGGAYGLDRQLITNADKVIRLSDMTLPHQMAKLILLEQIYRAETIRSGHPYHK